MYCDVLIPAKFSQKPCSISYQSLLLNVCDTFCSNRNCFPHFDAMRNRKFFERLPAGYLRCFRQQLLIVHWFHIQWGKVQTSDDTGDICRMQWLQPSPCLHEAVYLTHHAPCLLIAWKCVESYCMDLLNCSSKSSEKMPLNQLVNNALGFDIWTYQKHFQMCMTVWSLAKELKFSQLRTNPTQGCCLSIWAGHRNHKLRQTRLT